MVAAFAGHVEVSTAADRWWASESFRAFGIFMGLVLLPVASYFYAFHGDWFLFYLAHTGSVISPLGLLTLALVAAAAIGGFRLGTILCRQEDPRKFLNSALGVLGLGVALFLAGWNRTTVIGSQRQFEKQFGLESYWGSAAFWGGIWMTLLLAAAVAYLFYVLRARYSR